MANKTDGDGVRRQNHRFSRTHQDVKNLLAEHRITVKYELIRLWCNGFDRVRRRTKFDDMPRLLETAQRIGQGFQPLDLPQTILKNSLDVFVKGGEAVNLTGLVSNSNGHILGWPLLLVSPATHCRPSRAIPRQF